MATTLSLEQIEHLVYNQYANPFDFLGPHEVGQTGNECWTIRAVIPNAESVELVNLSKNTSHPIESTHLEHFYEIQLPGGEPLPDYQFKIKRYGKIETFHDPYRYRTPRLSDLDVYLFREGNHHRIYEKMGAHPTEIDGVAGVHFAVWAPNARNISVLGDFNHWDGRQHQMQLFGDSGIWQLFIPNLTPGTLYKYEVKNQAGEIYEKTDPYGFQQEPRPNTSSVVTDLNTHHWNDEAWIARRQEQDPLKQPISVYELHLGSWMHQAADAPFETGETGTALAEIDYKDNTRFLSYRELAHKIVPYVKELGFTHIELLPIAEHPFDGSWGYQVIGHYAATSRFGSPEDLMYFIDYCHQNDIGVIVDWVPGHFPKDGHGLAFFDGTHLYEHADPRKGEHKGWGTLIFNYSRNEVRNYLLANAVFWFDKYHIDGIRVDAVASMLYLDYDREDGEWVANEYGGRENIEAIDFLKNLNYLIFKYFPGALSIAEESTAWPMVTWPTQVGGLGFNLKWNMGWMHDSLDYFSMDPWFRQFNQNKLTFSIMYVHSENYMLALSHDEIVHGKSHMVGKMAGDEWGKLASLRALYGYMFGHPGKKTLFMSMEFGQWNEWNVWNDLDWHLLEYDPHKKLKDYVAALNTLYKQEPALHQNDFNSNGFQWIDCNDTSGVVSFIRRADDPSDYVVVVCNLGPHTRHNYRIGMPEHRYYKEILNSDAMEFWGSGEGNFGGKHSDQWACHQQPCSIELCLPPFSTLIFKPGEMP